jgi:hypothetical protein
MRRIELGTDEQAGLEADRSVDRGIGGTAHNGISSIIFKHQRTADAAPAEEIPGWWWRSA